MIARVYNSVVRLFASKGGGSFRCESEWASFEFELEFESAMGFRKLNVGSRNLS